jgi:ABC-type dipeptide/oligopeptide/nickel transport system permease subunit
MRHTRSAMIGVRNQLHPNYLYREAASKNFMAQAPTMSVFPGAAIFLVVLGFNLLGDGLRDALDPREN